MTDAELAGALDGLYAYDTGSTDSGIHDEALRARCIAEMASRRGPFEIAPRVFLSRLVAGTWLTDDALAAGYGIEDVMCFIRWLDERMDITL